MQRRMQMTSTVIADCHGNICMAGTQSIRTKERADRRARKKRIERGRGRRGGGRESERKGGRREKNKREEAVTTATGVCTLKLMHDYNKLPRSALG